ncbi:hypothetical protein N7510_006031 [Penicillium lagena]|uniref:uncharacterized protein n=1 Tax=Penicillium lagena TaxID=94218 RepID=UPI0025410175|nr:uncharacterized protein N7510_006031 [Penicillium lagena]KAJ5612837.1 hypothetical protein N7510_006031 [Penicillium lagena]
MQPSMRLLSREALASKSLYVCSTCRQEVSPRGLAPLTRPFRRYASDNSFTERARKKIWGTENPPGSKDPYGGEGQIAKAQTDLEQGETKLEVPEEVEEKDLLPSDEYEQADTWQGLKRLGYLEKNAWRQQSPTDADEVQPFAARPVDVTPDAIAQKVRQVATEICIMHMLKKKEQVANICSVDVHDRKIQEYLNSCVLHPSADGNWETALKFRSKHVRDVLFFVFKQIGGEQEPDLGSKTSSDHVGLPKEQPVLANLPLSDPSVKFIFFKRLAQLTGYRFSDKNINTLTTVGHASEHLQKWAESRSPKAKKKQWFDDVALPSNLRFKPRRERKSDRDEDFGRKKLYMAELYKSGLYQVPDTIVPPWKRPASE